MVTEYYSGMLMYTNLPGDKLGRMGRRHLRLCLHGVPYVHAVKISNDAENHGWSSYHA